MGVLLVTPTYFDPDAPLPAVEAWRGLHDRSAAWRSTRPPFPMIGNPRTLVAAQAEVTMRLHELGGTPNAAAIPILARQWGKWGPPQQRTVEIALEGRVTVEAARSAAMAAAGVVERAESPGECELTSWHRIDRPYEDPVRVVAKAHRGRRVTRYVLQSTSGGWEGEHSRWESGFATLSAAQAALRERRLATSGPGVPEAEEVQIVGIVRRPDGGPLVQSRIEPRGLRATYEVHFREAILPRGDAVRQGGWLLFGWAPEESCSQFHTIDAPGALG